MKSMLAAAAMLVAVSTASGQSSQPTVQQQFDAASSALGDENWAEALRLYEALENRIRRNPRTLAVVRVRKAEALARLRRFAEADEAVRLGLPSLSADDPTLREDRLRAFRTSGTIAELSLDFAEAARRYRAGMDIEGPIDQRLALHRGLIQNLIFSDRDAALPAADEALRIVGATPDNRRLRGQFKTLRGRALLNLGRNAEARTELLQAVSLLGGMTARVDAADIVARSDLALAALFLGDEATARRYLAMTGAGRFRTGALDPHWDNRPPPCGNGLRPEDVAVIEFALALDGSVLHASPVYATTTLAAREMSRAVQSWYFQPEQLASLHVLFRGLSRVELRCSRLESMVDRHRWRRIKCPSARADRGRPACRARRAGRSASAEWRADLRAAGCAGEASRRRSGGDRDSSSPRAGNDARHASRSLAQRAAATGLDMDGPARRAGGQ
jgi:tetratricopeptide (TPR) repeat protein